MTQDIRKDNFVIFVMVALIGLTQTALRPADLMNMPVPESGLGARHELIKSRILGILFAWSFRHGGGKVFSESMFSLGKQTARILDVAVILAETIAAMPDADVPIPFAPDLAVEVVSVSESAWAVEKKVREYLHAGVQEVWQVFPDERMVRVRRVGGTVDLEADDLLTSGVLEGFEVLVNRFFMG